ncbi:MAG: GNAT family N-acetyltransferase [Bacteroidota bacterium]
MISSAAVNDWERFYRMSQTASFFQSPEWSRVWEIHTGGLYRPEPLQARLPSGKHVLLPLTRQRLRGGIGSIWHAAPAGTYGGWLCEPGSELTNEETHLLLRSLFDRCGSLIFRPFPLSPCSVPLAMNSYDKSGSTLAGINQREWKAPSGVSVRPDRTWLLDCSDGFRAIMDRWSEGNAEMARKIKKAEDSGIIIRKARNEQDIETYYRLYIEATRRWNPPPAHVYPLSFIRLLAGDESKNGEATEKAGTGPAIGGSMEMWIAEYNGSVVAGSILLTGKNHASYWHGVLDPDYGKMRPVNLMGAAVIRASCEQGVHWFDFNPSMGLHGVERFKKSFGTKPAPCPVYAKTSGFVQATRVLGRLLRRVSRREDSQ